MASWLCCHGRNFSNCKFFLLEMFEAYLGLPYFQYTFGILRTWNRLCLSCTGWFSLYFLGSINFSENVVWQASCILFQAAAIRLEIRGSEWKNAYMQMDGEPWKQPLNKDFSTFLEIKRVPFQSLMISGDWFYRLWRIHVKPGFIAFGIVKYINVCRF